MSARAATVTLTIPAGAIVQAPAPLLVSAEAGAEYVGCSPKELTGILRDMVREPARWPSLVRKPGRRAFAASPEDVLRYLRTRPLPAANDAGVDAETREAERRMAEARL